MSWVIDFIREVLKGIVVSIASTYILYLIFGGQLTNLLESYFPTLPVLLTAVLLLAIFSTLLHKLYKSIRYRRRLEHCRHDLYMFLLDWDALRAFFNKVMQTNLKTDFNQFEEVRTRLLYNYPKITGLLRSMRMDYIDRLRGIHVPNYDLIGNFLAESPFTTMQWFQRTYRERDFMENWDRGRTMLVSQIGVYDVERNKIQHKLLQLFKLVPLLTKESTETEETE